MIPRGIFFLIIFALVSCAPTNQDIKTFQRKHDVESLINIINSGADKGLRIEAIKSLGYIRDPRAINGLTMALNSESWVERETAVKTLGKLRDHLVINPLISAMDDSSHFVRDSAGKALISVSKSLGKKKDPRILKHLIAAIETTHPKSREKVIEAFRGAVDQLSRVHEPTFIRILIDSVPHQSKYVRLEAVIALGNFNDPRVVTPLLSALKDDVSDVREAAADSLEKVKDPRAAEPLFAALKDEDPKVRNEAAITLGKFRDPQVINRIIRALNDDNDYIRAGAAKAMEYIIHPRAMMMLVALLDDLNTDVRMSASNALDKYHWRPRDDKEAAKYCVAKQQWNKCAQYGADAIQPLISALKGDDPNVRRFASNVLFELDWKPNSKKERGIFCVAKQDWEECVKLGEHSISALIQELKNKDWRIRISSAETLAEIGHVKAIDPLIASLDDPNADVRTVIVESLGTFRGEKVVGALIKALDDPNRGVRQTAANTLETSISHYKKSGDSNISHFFISALKDNNRGVRVVAAKLLGKLKDPAAAEHLIIALEDIDSDVRHEARIALNQIKDNRAIGTLVNALETDDPKVKTQVINALSKYKDHRAIEPLLAATKDSSSKVRKKAITALGEIKDPRAIDPIVASLKDYDPGVRRTAAKTLVKFDDPRIIQPLVKSMMDLDVMVRKEARKSIFQKNWTPKNAKEKALECIAKKEWQGCETLGESVVEPLILELKQDRSPDRIPAARVLGYIKDPRAIQPLVNAISSTQWMDDEFEKKNLINSASSALEKFRFKAVPNLKATLTRWYTAKYTAKVLDNIGWKPHTREERIHFLVAKRAHSELRENWQDAKRVLMKDIESKDENKISNALYAFIGLGKDEVITDLLTVLENSGTIQIAEAYLNSGHERLVNGAENWTAQRGLEVQQYSDGNSPVEWGRL